MNDEFIKIAELEFADDVYFEHITNIVKAIKDNGFSVCEDRDYNPPRFQIMKKTNYVQN